MPLAVQGGRLIDVAEYVFRALGVSSKVIPLGLITKSVRHFKRRTIFRSGFPPVVDPRRGDVGVT